MDNRQQVSNNLKRKAVDDPSEKPIKILHCELLKRLGRYLYIGTTCIRKSLYYNLIKNYPKRQT